ncbi:hypothetical protein HDV57DRAFT_461078 [Trichoderma longibrachiatum]|uniref:Uncharacterized protein n=1 Tax=Trichoderma longibrachiatum ATCC 18648 TaxID=983965 RepID=A0A2T4C592_TRILO|nr:hypothetical protein M440DRAFT_301628 [Trichoderma longibrachiatum ATCC 18648]
MQTRRKGRTGIWRRGNLLALLCIIYASPFRVKGKKLQLLLHFDMSRGLAGWLAGWLADSPGTFFSDLIPLPLSCHFCFSFFLTSSKLQYRDPGCWSCLISHTPGNLFAFFARSRTSRLGFWRSGKLNRGRGASAGPNSWELPLGIELIALQPCSGRAGERDSSTTGKIGTDGLIRQADFSRYTHWPSSRLRV